MTVAALTFPQQVEESYTKALEQYLTEPHESALLRAYELGREALDRGLGVVEMATIHSHAIAAVQNRPVGEDKRAELLEAQMSFFMEALAPFEMAHRAFRDANTALRRLNDMLEGQAKRIAYSLHDEAGQLLAAMHLALAEAARLLPPETAEQLATVKDLVNQIEERLRNISHELRPPVLNLGLFPALEVLKEIVSKRWGLPVSLSVSLHGDLPATVETTVYRIAQEALTNAAKHARATQAEIDVRQTAHKLVCSVRDDGIGFDADDTAARLRRGLGLLEIKERVAAMDGVLRVGPNRNGGTNLTIEIPLEG